MRKIYGSITLSAVALFGASGVACNTEAYCFDCESGTGSGGIHGGVNGSGGSAGFEVPPDGTGGGIVIINDCNADLENDPLNCGRCDFVCEIPNAFPTCEESFCIIDRCALGYYDVDGAVGNGCEYECEPRRDGAGEPVRREEFCDGEDDDCDGNVDENFDTDSDILHCGACNEACPRPPHTEIACESGACTVVSCQENWEDLNGDLGDNPTDGCECNVIGLEECNYVDDDCDGEIDEGIDTTDDPDNCGACGNVCGEVFPNGATACVDSACVFDGCLDGFYDIDGELINGCEYECTPTAPGEEACDGEDNDCNGFVDDSPTDTELGQACGESTGECEEGTWVCAGGAVTCSGGVAATTEICDGLNNDCDGTGTDGDIDEGCPTRGTRTRLDLDTSRGEFSSAQLTVATQGEAVFAAWVDRRNADSDNNNPDIFFNFSTDGGDSWQDPDMPVADSSSLEIEPWLFTSQTHVYLVLGRFDSANAPRRIHLTADELAPDGWTTPQRVEVGPTDSGPDSFFGRGIVANDVADGASDQIVVIWQSLEGTGADATRDIYLQASTDGGTTWLDANVLVNTQTGGIGRAELPSIATDGNGKVFVVWRDAASGRPEAWVNSYDFAGAGLGTAMLLSSDTDAASVKPPVVAADGAGNVHVLWTELPDNAAKIVRGRSSTDGGATFSTAVAVSQPPAGASPDADTPAVAARSGMAVAVWEDTRAGQPDIYASRWDGTVWGAPAKADGGPRGTYRSLEPQVALGAGDRVFVSYRGYRGTGDDDLADVFANFSDADPLLFQPDDVRVDEGFGGLGAIDSFAPHLVTRDGGNEALVVWLDNRDGANADPYAAILDFP